MTTLISSKCEYRKVVNDVGFIHTERIAALDMLFERYKIGDGF